MVEHDMNDDDAILVNQTPLLETITHVSSTHSHSHTSLKVWANAGDRERERVCG